MTKTFEEVPVATVEVIPTFDGNEIKFKPSSKLENYLIAEGEVELYLRTQYQPLPVVPECVAEFITKVKKADNNLTFAFNSKFDECPAKYWNEAIVWRLNHPEEFARAWLDGYTVEKPQLFYLKNKLTTSYLALDINTGYYEHWGEEIIPKLLNKQGYKTSFTQEEIDSMETGSYELVPVEDGE